MTSDRRRCRTAALAVGLLVTMAAPLVAQGATPVAPAEALTTPSGRYHAPAKPMPGAQAIQALDSAGLSAAAIVNEMAHDQLLEILEEDRTAWLDGDGRLFYVEPPAPASTHPTPVGTAGTPYPLAAAFDLHSRPSSTHTIFIDFDGAQVRNTAWNADYGVGVNHPAFSIDADSSAFNAAELAAIQSIWQRVSEDYAAFDVDVTTQDPGAGAIDRATASDQVFGTRALVTASTDAAGKICANSCGGIAYVGVYDLLGTNHSYYQPAWIFPQRLGPNDPKSVAEAVSHEVGHNFGLNHDATASTGYYSGHNQWAPIMGVGYDRPVVQWSKGEYAAANNTEDDLAIIAANGAPVLADDAGNTVSTASAFTTTARIISTRADKDVFKLARCTTQTVVRADPAPVSPDLDIKLDILRANGSVLASNNPASKAVDPDIASGLNATVRATLPAGTTYFVRVDGLGVDSASTGYTDYASIGRYTLARSCA